MSFCLCWFIRMANNLPSFLVTTSHWSIFCEEIANESTASLNQGTTAAWGVEFSKCHGVPCFRLSRLSRWRRQGFSVLDGHVQNSEKAQGNCSMWYQETGSSALESSEANGVWIIYKLSYHTDMAKKVLARWRWVQMTMTYILSSFYYLWVSWW